MKRNNTSNSMRIVVAGDTGTGKSSLIHTAVLNEFPTKVPPVLPPSRLYDDSPDRLPMTIIDTSSGREHSDERADEFKRADGVVLTYACDRHDTFDSLSSYWLPELRRLKVKLPVVLVGCKFDLSDHQQQFSLQKLVLPILEQFREIDSCIECSSYEHIQALQVFNYAQKSVLHPTPPVFDLVTKTLTPQYLKALKRIFRLCDLDRDGALSDVELKKFLVKCFPETFRPSTISNVKEIMRRKLPEGVNERGLTFKGFLCLHEYLLEPTGARAAWTILRNFGYNNDIRLASNILPPSFKPAPDQIVELSNVALDFLRGSFSMYDKDNAGVIRPADLEDWFSTAPDCPWSESPYMDAASTTASGGLTLNGLLSEWVLVTLLEPAKTVEYLKYIMYDGDAASAIRLARRRCKDRKKRQSERNVYQCFVFGPEKAGKSALLDNFLGRPFSDASIPNTEDRYAVNVVDGTAGSQKFLVLREIPEAKVKDLLSNKESLATCDMALFVYDSTDESSFKKTAKLLAEVSRHGEDTGYEVPSLIVSAKDDLDSYTKSIKDSTWLSEDMGIDAPIPISAKRGDFNELFQRIVTTAEHPHLTEVGRSRNQYYLRPVDRSLITDSVGDGAAGWHCRIGCLSCLFFFCD
ncbi:hypothetical protein KSS87_004505 [Heliosperma pusillum]|nr:hypothetical protein KSS87_004505 [Heliosperma pusillum]